MKFAHLSDCHLGGWRQPELNELNMQAFCNTIDTCIDEKVDFVLFAGDLFDSAFPPIETLKDTFNEFRRLKEEKIRNYVIAGSHDYSVSGKTFLEVLEKAGFCEICKYETTEETITLKPSLNNTCHIYGFPGKKSGLEIKDLKKVQINEPFEKSFRILMLHTTIPEVAGTIPVETINLLDLPKADYYALGHIHVDFEKEINGGLAIYSGPLFPNNFKEFEDLKYGSFYIIEVEGYTKVIKKEVKLKEVISVKIELSDSLTGTAKILKELEKLELGDKIVLLRISGNLEKGKPSDIKYREIQEYLEKRKVFSFLKNTSNLEIGKQDMQIEFQSNDMEKVEIELVKKYEVKNPSLFNKKIFQLMESLSMEKQEGEKNAIFEERLIQNISNIMEINFDS